LPVVGCRLPVEQHRRVSAFIGGFVARFFGGRLSSRNSALDHSRSSAGGASPSGLKAAWSARISLRSSTSGRQFLVPRSWFLVEG